MALPTAFSNNTSPTGPQLDANEAALGALTVIGCVVSGTNTLVLAPLTNAPTVVSYANYGRFSGVASATNTGATTGRVGGLAALAVYRDTPAGPVPLVGGEIVAGCAFVLIYDSALNSGAGGFHLNSTANSIAATGGTITGSLSFVNGTLSTLTISGASIGAPTLTGGYGSLGSLMVGATAATLTRMVTNIATLSYTVVPANSSQVQNMTLTGAAVNDVISLGPPASVTTGLGFFGFVPAAGTVSVRAMNITAASIAAFSVTMRASALGMA